MPSITLALFRLPKHLAALVLALLPLATIGCGTGPALTLTSIDHGQSYRQGFTQAYINHNTDGDIDIVLVDQDAAAAKADAPANSVHQVMHIRVLWEPTSDMKPVVFNASVKWFVIGRSNPPQIMQYTGIAFVSLNEDDGKATVRVRNASLKPVGAHGTMVDPVGESRLDGAFVAQVNPEMTAKVLSDLKSTVSSSR